MSNPLVYLEGTVLYYQNGVHLGEVFAMEDGHFYFWPPPSAFGGWSEELIVAIGELLAEKNVPIRAQMEEYFEQEGKEEVTP